MVPVGCDEIAASPFALAELVFGLGATSAVLALTMSCSPSSLGPNADIGVPGEIPSRSKDWGGYPYLTSKAGIEVTSKIFASRSEMEDSSGNVTAVWPFGPRTRKRMLSVFRNTTGCGEMQL